MSTDTKDIKRLFAKVTIDDSGCWLFTGGAISRKGYGRFCLGGRERPAHVAAWMLLRGDVPHGHHVDHLCRVRHCVNPAHLEPVTPRENLLRGNTKAAENVAKTHCPHGHAYDEANTQLKVRPGGISRACRECNREDVRRRRRRAAA